MQKLIGKLFQQVFYRKFRPILKVFRVIGILRHLSPRSLSLPPLVAGGNFLVVVLLYAIVILENLLLLTLFSCSVDSLFFTAADFFLRTKPLQDKFTS